MLAYYRFLWSLESGDTTLKEILEEMKKKEHWGFTENELLNFIKDITEVLIDGQK